LGAVKGDVKEDGIETRSRLRGKAALHKKIAEKNLQKTKRGGKVGGGKVRV